MEKWLTVNEYMDTFFNFLMAVGALGSLIYVGKGFQLAKGYLKQHDEKISLERKKIAAEGAMKALLKFDQQLTQCFNDLRLRNDPKFLESEKKIIQDHLADELFGRGYISEILITQLAFTIQITRYHEVIWGLNGDMMFHGSILKDSSYHRLELEYNDAVKTLIRFMAQPLDNFSDKDFDDLQSKYPFSLYDSEKPVIREYDRAGNALKDYFLKYCD